MSEYQECSVEIEDEEILFDSLEELGVPRQKIEKHEKPVCLRGYYGNETQSAEIVVRADAAGNRYDIGFNKVDGKFVAIYEHMDYAAIVKELQRGGLKRCYTKSKVLKELKKLRCKPTIETLQDGRVRIRAKIR